MSNSHRIAINGFGRIGRHLLRAILARDSFVEVVAVHDLTLASTLAHLLEFDTVHGRLAEPVEAVGDELRVGGRRIRILSSSHPANLPWSELGVDVVAECSGRFTTREQAAGHLLAGANRVVVSTPTDSADATICVGVNDHTLDPVSSRIISNASCTTNCVAPMLAVLDESFGVREGWVQTVHAYTNDQDLLDLPHHDLRRGRAAAQNIVPTGTGADRALSLVLPQLAGVMHSSAVRVPVPDGSLSSIVCTLGRDGHAVEVSAEQINAALSAASRSSRLSGILSVTKAPVVSSDVLGDAHSCLVSTMDTETYGAQARVFGWYDNEWGYANRLLDLIEMVSLRTNDRQVASTHALRSLEPALTG